MMYIDKAIAISLRGGFLELTSCSLMPDILKLFDNKIYECSALHNIHHLIIQLMLSIGCDFGTKRSTKWRTKPTASNNSSTMEYKVLGMACRLYHSNCSN